MLPSGFTSMDMCGSSLTEFAKLLHAAGEHHVVEGKGALGKAVRWDGE